MRTQKNEVFETNVANAVQLAACCPKLAFLVNSTARILDAVADGLLVNIQSDVIHMSLRSLRGCCLNQPSG